MTDRDRRFALHQHEGHRLTDNVAGPNDDRIAPADLDAFVLEQPHHAVRRARGKDSIADDETADIIEMESIDILFGVDSPQHLLQVEARRQRQLHENAVNARIPAALSNLVADFRLPDRRRIKQLLRPDADILAGPDLVAHIDRRRRVVADHNDGKAGRPPASLSQPGHTPLAVFAFGGGNRLAVDDLGYHSEVDPCFAAVRSSASRPARPPLGKIRRPRRNYMTAFDQERPRKRRVQRRAALDTLRMPILPGFSEIN